MSVQINLHKIHRQYTDGKEVVDVEGKTVGECLNDLIIKYPLLEEALYAKNGTLNTIIEVYLNGTSAYPNALEKEVKDGDKIHLLYILAGG